jgi:hypothetical protein
MTALFARGLGELDAGREEEFTAGKESPYVEDFRDVNPCDGTTELGESRHDFGGFEGG